MSPAIMKKLVYIRDQKKYKQLIKKLGIGIEPEDLAKAIDKDPEKDVLEDDTDIDEFWANDLAYSAIFKWEIENTYIKLSFLVPYFLESGLSETKKLSNPDNFFILGSPDSRILSPGIIAPQSSKYIFIF